MKKLTYLVALLFFLGASISGCKKSPPQDELSKLPPPTQEGKNTFGCLVNRKAWVAKIGCNIICDPAFTLYYDASNGGRVSLTAQNTVDGNDSGISIGIDSAQFYNLFDFSRFGDSGMAFIYNNYELSPQCSVNRSDDPVVAASGIVHISKFDLTNRIISGTFEFYLSKPGCDTIKVTNGRFDGRLY